MKKKVFFLFNILLYVSCLAAELNMEDEEIKSALSHNNYEPNYFSLFLGLFLVIALIYLTGYIYQKLIKVKINQEDDETNKPQILSTVSLGQGKNLHIVKINNEYILIGATQNNISYLKDLDKRCIVKKSGKVDEKD